MGEWARPDHNHLMSTITNSARFSADNIVKKKRANRVQSSTFNSLNIVWQVGHMSTKCHSGFNINSEMREVNRSWLTFYPSQTRAFITSLHKYWTLPLYLQVKRQTQIVQDCMETNTHLCGWTHLLIYGQNFLSDNGWMTNYTNIAFICQVVLNVYLDVWYG